MGNPEIDLLMLTSLSIGENPFMLSELCELVEEPNPKKLIKVCHKYPQVFTVNEDTVRWTVPLKEWSDAIIRAVETQSNNNNNETTESPQETKPIEEKQTPVTPNKKKPKSKKQRLKEQKAKQQMLANQPPAEANKEEEEGQNESEAEETMQDEEEEQDQLEEKEQPVENLVDVVKEDPIEIKKTEPKPVPKNRNTKGKWMPKQKASAPSQKPKRKDHSKEARRIFDRTNGHCYLCRKPLVFENRQWGQPGAWHMDHVLNFAHHPDLDHPSNLLPAHVECDSCKGPHHLQSIVNENDYNLLTLSIGSLNPVVAEQMRAAKELYKKQKVTLPDLLDSNHFPRLPQNPKNNDNTRNNDNNNNQSNPSKTADINKFIIRWSDLKLSDEKLGEGTFSTVWKAKHKGTPVAVKKLLDVSEENTKKFEAEVSLLSNLRHPNVILMIGVCVPPDPCAIVTELFEKKSLQHVLDSKTPIDFSTKLRFALDIARGMCYLHSINILHLDLKPLNIMVDDSHRCKIADFGLSKSSSLRSNGAHYATNEGLIGTVVYMSPEMIEHSPTVDFAADVYSYAIILWQIYTRDIPYKGVIPVQVMRFVADKQQRPTIPADCPAEYAELIKRCWKHEPTERPRFDTVVEILEAMMLK